MLACACTERTNVFRTWAFHFCHTRLSSTLLQHVHDLSKLARRRVPIWIRSQGIVSETNLCNHGHFRVPDDADDASGGSYVGSYISARSHNRIHLLCPVSVGRTRVRYQTLQHAYMRLSSAVATTLLLSEAVAQHHPRDRAEYRSLPSLREQAKLLDDWRDQRLARVPALLKKYDVDAWLVGSTFV